MTYTSNLAPREGKFVRALIAGANKKDSAIIAGYTPTSAGVQASRLLRKDKIRHALDKAGLTDKAIAGMLKVHAEQGLGVRPTSDTSLKAISLVMQAKGQLATDNNNTNNTTNNVYINELKVLTTEQLQERLTMLQEETKSL